MRGKLEAAARNFENLEETLADYQQTIQKFCGLVANLREENNELKKSKQF
ncbi:hypothetical protein B4U80_02737, partial [Leptotrombidium deliense]